MINELRVLLTAWTDRLADIIAPTPRHAQVMADLLAEAEASAEVSLIGDMLRAVAKAGAA